MRTKLLLLLVLQLIIANLSAQDYQSDLLLIGKKSLVNTNDFQYYKRAGNNAKIMESHSHSVISKVNPLSAVLKGAMLLYQNVLSPQLSKSCAYQITCSNFSKQAIARFGIVKGMCLSADRLMRCNRIALLDINLLDIDESTGTIIDPLTRY
jgi:putative component of membrane protein insertase Oxa1/YidC/SpoIIIJ protein YidD